MFTSSCARCWVFVEVLVWEYILAVIERCLYENNKYRWLCSGFLIKSYEIVRKIEMVRQFLISIHRFVVSFSHVCTDPSRDNLFFLDSYPHFFAEIAKARSSTPSICLLQVQAEAPANPGEGGRGGATVPRPPWSLDLICETSSWDCSRPRPQETTTNARWGVNLLWRSVRRVWEPVPWNCWKRGGEMYIGFLKTFPFAENDIFWNTVGNDTIFKTAVHHSIPHAKISIPPFHPQRPYFCFDSPPHSFLSTILFSNNYLILWIKLRVANNGETKTINELEPKKLNNRHKLTIHRKWNLTSSVHRFWTSVRNRLSLGNSRENDVRLHIRGPPVLGSQWFHE